MAETETPSGTPPPVGAHVALLLAVAVLVGWILYEVLRGFWP